MTSTSRQGTAEDADGQNYTLPYPTQPICILPNLFSHYLPYPALISSILICSTFHPNDTLHYLLLPIPTPHYIILLYPTSAYLPILPYIVLHPLTILLYLSLPIGINLGVATPRLWTEGSWVGCRDVVGIVDGS